MLPLLPPTSQGETDFAYSTCSGNSFVDVSHTAVIEDLRLSMPLWHNQPASSSLSRPTDADDSESLMSRQTWGNAATPSSNSDVDNAQSVHLGMGTRGFANPIMNSIQFIPVMTMTAVLYNAQSLHLDLVKLRTPGYMSPFYRQAGPHDDPQMMLASASKPWIPDHLQPTLAQVLYPHHAFLDVLPFPLLRARLLVMLALMPHAIDLVDFKRDTLRRGALVCWTSSSNAQPWDMRSWEVAPWFLDKWKMLVDVEGDEIRRQSSWWEAMRGMDVQLSVPPFGLSLG